MPPGRSGHLPGPGVRATGEHGVVRNAHMPGHGASCRANRPCGARYAQVGDGRPRRGSSTAGSLARRQNPPTPASVDARRGSGPTTGRDPTGHPAGPTAFWDARDTGECRSRWCTRTSRHGKPTGSPAAPAAAREDAATGFRTPPRRSPRLPRGSVRTRSSRSARRANPGARSPSAARRPSWGPRLPADIGPRRRADAPASPTARGRKDPPPPPRPRPFAPSRKRGSRPTFPRPGSAFRSGRARAGARRSGGDRNSPA